MTTEELEAAVLGELDAVRGKVAQMFAAQRIAIAQPGDDLPSLLKSGRPVHLVAGATYAGLSLPSGARLVGHGAFIVGKGRPALTVAPGVSDVMVEDVVCASDWNGAVVQLGDNDATTQGTVDRVPSAIVLTRVKVPTHRGKRGFEINATNVTLTDCEARDVYTTTGQDSSAVGILNTPGGIAISGGTFEAGSEAILVGGDAMKLAGVTAPAQLLFERLTMTRPETWRTDGVTRVVKNLFELKTGHGVIVRDCVLEHCWKDGQDGYAIMLTPTRGGSLRDVLFERVKVRDVGGGINITGIHPDFPDAGRTTGIVFRDCSFQISKATNGGTGRLVLLTNGPESLEMDGITAQHDGNAVLYQSGPQMERISVTYSTFNSGIYGFMLGGVANALKWQLGTKVLDVTGNTISGAAAALKSALPANTYVS